MTYVWVATMIVLNGAAGLVGALLPERWLERYRTPMLGVAAVTLLATGLFEILPEALARSGTSALGWSAGMIVVLGAIEWASSRRRAHDRRPVAPLALLSSDALHNVSDGMAIAAAFLISTELGFVTAIAVIVHEVPEEVADYALLRATGMTKVRALGLLAGVQLTAGIGAASTLMASSVIARAEGVLLSIACGTFVYIALVNLGPELLPARRRRHHI
ncbi:MAG: zupT [Deltaproteobacteria bacterium]|nr:zupT [Deltaproteobacteria bacterium]